jgi:glycosyltransferase involved in cell wall biosynthesis
MATLHDVFHDWQLSSLKGRIARAAIEAMLAKVDVVQSVSNDAHENLVRWMPKLKAKKGKAIVIPNGVDASLYSSAAVRDIRQEIELDDDAFLIGFLGRFMGQKGFRVLIRAVEQLVRDDLPRRPVVIAVGGGGFVREDSALISRLGLSSNFRFLPFAPDVASTIRGLNVVAIPSLWEAGPILPMETMMAGTPLIGSSCIGLREVMEGSPAIAVRPGDESALASAIKYVMKNENRERFAMGQYVEIAKARFDVEKSIARLRETLDRLAK